MTQGRTVTLKDIANTAGVSLMTVSRALRKHASVSPETQSKIEAVAKELGYRPNPLISALMSYRRAGKAPQSHSVIAFVTSFPTRDGWKARKIYQEFFQGAFEAADRHGYRLEEFWLRENGMNAHRLSNIFYSRNINGVIVAPLPVSVGHLSLDWEKFSAVTFSYTLARPILHRASNHQFRSMRMAMRQLRRLGYKRIGLAMPASCDHRIDDQWTASFLMEQQRASTGKNIPLCVIDDKDWCEAAFRSWFVKNIPDVILSQQPKILEWLQAMNKRVPADVGFVHLSCPDESGKFAGIYQNSQVIGRVAVDFLVGMIQRNERGIPALPHTILVEGTWIDGDTLRKPGANTKPFLKVS
jgi:LacI family transcriptional regulator